jgi:tetratricopeptide (TPR) repeat protein
MPSKLVPTIAAVAALASAVPAAAQTAAPAPAAPAAAAQPLCQAGISKGARKAIIALQTAVGAKDTANIPARIADAQAVAKTNDDRCLIAQMQVVAAVDAGNLAAVPAAIEAQRASGSVPAARIAALYEGLAKMQYDKGSFADAAASYQRAIAAAPGRAEPVIMLGESYFKQNRAAEALPQYQKAIALETAAGRKADENWYKRAVAVAHGAKSPLTPGLAREWVTAYPTPTNWREAIGVYAMGLGSDEGMLVDLWRLQRLTRSLKGEADHARYAQALLVRGYPGEAKAMLEEGFAANAVDRTRASVKNYHALATQKAAGDRAALDTQAKAALASSAAKQAMVLGEAYFGYGDYAKAAAMFRAAQGKSGVDAELANLRLGMALAASGDKAGATAALAKVTGPRAEIARYWQTYLATRG